MKQQDSIAKNINNILFRLNAFLSGGNPSQIAGIFQWKYMLIYVDGLFALLEASCLVPVLEAYLKNDSLLDMGRQIFLYRTVLHTLRILVSQVHK